jgi:hypothetical protein
LTPSQYLWVQFFIWWSPRAPSPTNCGSSKVPFIILTLFQHLQCIFC